jgi:tetratricopeptide (TPR) repeat protein
VTDDHATFDEADASAGATPEEVGAAASPSHDVSAEADGPAAARPGLAWQFPLIAVSAAAIAAAVLFRQPEPLPPDLDAALAAARSHLERGELESAADRLVFVERNLGDRADLLAAYHLAVADHRAASLQPLLTAPAAQAAQVVEAFERAMADGALLDPPRRQALAEAMVATGRDADALSLLALLEADVDPIGREEIRTLRHRLIRREIDRQLAAGAPVEAVSAGLERLLQEDTSLEIDAWSTAVDARLRLQSGEVDGLARGLGLAMHRLEGRAADEPWVRIDWAELWVLLGHAYRDELQAQDRAAECYRMALDRLRAIGVVAAEASLSLGELQVSAAREAVPAGGIVGPESFVSAESLEDATSRFDAVLGMSDATIDQKIAARVGLVSLALLHGDHESALTGLDGIGAFLERGSLVGRAVRDSAVDTALRGAEIAMVAAEGLRSTPDAGDVEVVALLDAAATHADFVRRFAESSATRHRGLEFLASARAEAAALLVEPVLGVEDPRVDRAMAIMPVEVRLESARRFAAAADALDRIEADLSGDDPGRFDVLWRAAVLHDKAGAVEPALDRYTRFVESQSTDAAMWPEAAFRVAAAHHALRHLPEAKDWYLRLLTTMEDGRDEVSEFTTRARVGLARVLLEQGDSMAMGDAESHLKRVLEGTARDAVEPSVPEYRDALLHLVRLLGRTDRWNEMAGRGEEWLSRYPQDPRWGEMAIRTGEGLFRHAEALHAGQRDADALNPGLAAEREEERRRSLRLAAGRLQAGVSELDRNGGEDLDPLESGLLRSGFLLRGMVADRLGDAEASIRLYREAEQRFAGEPVAIVALISMADVASRAGDVDTAGRATARARKRLEHLHRDTGPGGWSIDPLGPELLLGPGHETIDRWITAFPPGVEEEIG